MIRSPEFHDLSDASSSILVHLMTSALNFASQHVQPLHEVRDVDRARS